MPTSSALDRHWEENHKLLADAARNAGIDPAIVVKIAGFESGFDIHARPINRRHPERNTIRQFDGTMATSSAYGLGQFTNDTWLETLQRYGAKYGVADAAHLTKAQANATALRNDPNLQAAMLAEFTRDNIARGQRLGGPDADANVYALHNLGSGDGPKFLRALHANPNSPVSMVLSPEVIHGNPALYGDGTRTLAEAYRVMGTKMGDYASYAARVQTTTPKRDEQPGSAASQRPSSPPHSNAQGGAAIYNEARLYFIDGADRFEYGRGDIGRSRNQGGDRLTDQSRNERDLDGDGRKGVDCSSFVWRGLRNAGYDVPNSPFTTHDLFNGHAITAYARQHFDVIPAAHAGRDRGALKPGDVLLFRDRAGSGQHVGIFRGYAENGHIQFIGSQTTTGPGEQIAKPGGYWNGQHFEIVGALRAKSEFQVRAPLHEHPNSTTQQPTPSTSRRSLTSPDTGTPTHPIAPSTAHTDPILQMGEKGPAVIALQRRLFELGYHGQDGKPLGVDGDFGSNTLYALKQFQREHGLEGRGIAGPKTTAALERAERALMPAASHPQHRLYEQVLDKVREAEKTRGIAVGAHSERIAAALVVECLREGITRVDRVELNDRNTLARAVQVSPMRDESGLNRSTDAISLPQASRQPLAESAEQALQVAVNVQTRQQDMQRRQAQPVPAPAL